MTAKVPLFFRQADSLSGVLGVTVNAEALDAVQLSPLEIGVDEHTSAL